MKYTDISKQWNMALKEPRNKGKSRTKFILLVTIIILIGVVLYIFRGKVKEVFNPVSIIANVSAANIVETDGRTNILVIGSDERDSGAESARILTDTMMIVSIGILDNNVVMVSLPRDLWVANYKCTTDICGGSTYKSDKLNAVYEYGGVEELKNVVENVTGVPIHYYVVVTFDLFKDAINTLGGIDVMVDNAFTDRYYPIEGMETNLCGMTPQEAAKLPNEFSFPCRWKTISFPTGPQAMDATTALEFARSRHGDNNEDTDFARAKRQQKVIVAIKDKALSLETLLNPTKLKGLYDSYSKNVTTNVDFKTLESFALLSQQINFDKAVSVVLDDRSEADKGGLLYAPSDATLYGGLYVLVPRTGDFSQVHAYMQKYIFGN